MNVLIIHFQRAWKWTNSFCLHQQNGNNSSTGLQASELHINGERKGCSNMHLYFLSYHFSRACYLLSICFAASCEEDFLKMYVYVHLYIYIYKTRICEQHICHLTSVKLPLSISNWDIWRENGTSNLQSESGAYQRFWWAGSHLL